MRHKIFPYLILLPTLVFLFAFTYFPLLRSAMDSLFDSRMASSNPPFVGLQNYQRLFEDAVFWRALLNNLAYILMTVIPGIVLALLLAVALWENTSLNRWLRTAFFFPMIIPLVSAATLWLFIFMPGMGLLDYYLAKFFGPMNNNYLGMSNTALNCPERDWRLEVRRVLHAVFPGRFAVYSCFGARGGADGRRVAYPGVFLHYLAAAETDHQLCGHYRADLFHHPNRPRRSYDSGWAEQRNHRAALLHSESRQRHARFR